MVLVISILAGLLCFALFTVRVNDYIKTRKYNIIETFSLILLFIVAIVLVSGNYTKITELITNALFKNI